MLLGLAGVVTFEGNVQRGIGGGDDDADRGDGLKFGPAVAEELVRLLDRAPDPERVAKATEALLDCDAAEDFVQRVREA